MRRFVWGAYLAATVVALAAPGAFASSDAILNQALEEREHAADRIAEAAARVGTAEGSTGPETIPVKVAEIQGMPESDLKLKLRAMYSTSKDAQEKQIYPYGSLEAMQEVLNALGSVDDEARDVGHFMNRYAYLLGKVLDSYNNFFSVKVALGNPKISREDYKIEVAKLPAFAKKWSEANELLVAFLKIATNDLRDKWDQGATTEKRLREVLIFCDRLRDVYEAQRRLFRTGYTLAQLRYMEHADHQADLSMLMEDARQKAALAEFDDALENIREKTHIARKAAAKSVEGGILPSEYLTLLPFPRDKQRELDDLPDEEL